MQEINRLPVIYKHSINDISQIAEDLEEPRTKSPSMIKSGEQSITFDETVNIKIMMGGANNP